MKDPVPDTVPVPCFACGKSVVVPGGPVRSSMREGRDYIVFCSRRCNVSYVAREGTAQQEKVVTE